MTDHLYDTHLAEYRKNSALTNMEEYRRLCAQSLDDPDQFWAGQAETFLSWEKKWDSVLCYDFDRAEIRWFDGGVLNACHNCLDRHLPEHGDRVAYYWEGDEPGQSKRVTYSELYRQVNRFAAVLRSRGVAKGDRVIIYMPRIVETVVAALACARIGAIHSIVFGGFSAKALAQRILDSGAKMLVTVDRGLRAGKSLPFKENADKALTYAPCIETLIVLHHSGRKSDLNSPKEIGWHEAMSDPSLPDYIAPEPMNAEDPLFILYNSGTVGRPLGMVHTHGGYLLHTAMATRLIFDAKPGDTFWCTADIGWIFGHSFALYGPLINGLSIVLFEGVPWYPDCGRYWSITEKYRVNQFYTAPTVIRILAGAGDAYVKKHDLSSLRVLGYAGDSLDADAWKWYYRCVGNQRCPVLDTYCQVETGAPVLTSLPGLAPVKPGSCAFPFFGTDPVILDDTGEEALYPGQEGVLCLRRPWPGMVRSIYGDHEQFTDLYFSQIPGMFFTADAAFRDEDGYFRIIGRIDEVINVSGHRLGTAEIESALQLHKDVSEAAVVGYPHPVRGQGIYAFVTLKPGAIGGEELRKDLIRLVREEIGPIVTINCVQWAEELPKTRSGKIIRHILEKIAAGKSSELEDMSDITDTAVIEKLIREHIGPREI